VAWLAHWMQRMDHAHEKFGAMMDVPLTMRPSEYVTRQVWLTFLDDALGARSAQEIGEHTFMWGSDFPHGDSTWPHSRQVIEKNLGGTPDAVARKILHDNAAHLYRIPQ
jgi:predicted TIM-barrel fold metal-dependent hydrolase